MKNSILDALADNRLAVDLKSVEQTVEYLALKRELEQCIEEGLSIIGEAFRTDFKHLFSLKEEYSQEEAKDSFRYAFRFGVLSTVEVWMNREQLMIPKEKAGEPQSGKQFHGVVLEYLGLQRILPEHPTRSTEKRCIEIDHEEELLRKNIIKAGENQDSQIREMFNQFENTEWKMLNIIKKNAYIHGYCLSVSLIQEIFQQQEMILEGYE